MKRRVRLLGATRVDLARLTDFLIEVNPGAAEKIGELLERSVLSLGEFSGRPPVTVLPREAIITRIFHTREDR